MQNMRMFRLPDFASWRSVMMVGILRSCTMFEQSLPFAISGSSSFLIGPEGDKVETFVVARVSPLILNSLTCHQANIATL